VSLTHAMSFRLQHFDSDTFHFTIRLRFKFFLDMSRQHTSACWYYAWLAYL